MKTISKIVTASLLGATIVAASAIVTQCYAGTITSRCVNAGVYGTTCTAIATGFSRSGDGQPVAIEADPDKEARIAKWEAFCKPVGKPDAYGVVRLSYAHPGCEFGRTQ